MVLLDGCGGGGCRDDDAATAGSGGGVDVLNEAQAQDKKFVKEEEAEEQNSSSSSSSCLIKEETTAAKNGGDGGCALSAKPMEGLNEIGPPPFLKKIYEMVEDPKTDPVVSWSEDRNSFIVWDSHQLSKNLLPKYFKHCNFSSFIRQLNTYGFRKIDSDKWEFANEGFQRGKKHLLKNIKRRSRYNNYRQQQHLGMAMGMSLEDLTKKQPAVETELETLKTDNNILKTEMSRLREQQQDSQNQLTVFEERVRCVECKHQQMFSFLTKMSTNPAFFRQLLLQKRSVFRKELDENHDIRNKRRLLGVKPIDASRDVNCENHVQEDILSMQSELTQMFPEVVIEEPGPVKLPFQASIDHKTTSTPGAAICTAPSRIYDEELSTNDSIFFLELEDHDASSDLKKEFCSNCKRGHVHVVSYLCLVSVFM